MSCGAACGGGLLVFNPEFVVVPCYDPNAEVHVTRDHVEGGA